MTSALNIQDGTMLPRTATAIDSASDASVSSKKVGKGPVVSVSNLTKTYHLYSRPIDRLKKALGLPGVRSSTFHALDDVSFKIEHGDQIGIIGPNGAGKSTLLQILSGVLTPSSGKVEVNGTVAALLELGAGFNAELSGRENAEFFLKLYNHDAKAIAERIEQIREFADVGTFFDQPMKLYSSGMFVRVAFAANTLADPEILIVDEALSVGDVRFQKKCFDHMSRLKQRGITIILVTHDIFTAKSFCERLLLLHGGRLVCDGDPAAVVSQYYALLFPGHSTAEPSSPVGKGAVPAEANPSQDGAGPEGSRKLTQSDYILNLTGSDLRQSWGSGGARITALRVYRLRPPNLLPQAGPLKIELDLEFDAAKIAKICKERDIASRLFMGVRVDSKNGVVLFDLTAAVDDPDGLNIDPLSETNASVSIDCVMPTLRAGDYFLTPGIAAGSPGRLVPLWSCDNAAMITIEAGEVVRGLIKPNYSVRRVR